MLGGVPPSDTSETQALAFLDFIFLEIAGVCTALSAQSAFLPTDWPSEHGRSCGRRSWETSCIVSSLESAALIRNQICRLVPTLGKQLNREICYISNQQAFNFSNLGRGQLGPTGRSRYFLIRRRARSSRFLRLSWNVGSFFRLSMCWAIAARMISETGRASTSATVSRASACSADKRMVIALTGFMGQVWPIDTKLVKYHNCLVS